MLYHMYVHIGNDPYHHYMYVWYNMSLPQLHVHVVRHVTTCTCGTTCHYMYMWYDMSLHVHVVRHVTTCTCGTTCHYMYMWYDMSLHVHVVRQSLHVHVVRHVTTCTCGTTCHYNVHVHVVRHVTTMYMYMWYDMSLPPLHVHVVHAMSCWIMSSHMSMPCLISCPDYSTFTWSALKGYPA